VRIGALRKRITIQEIASTKDGLSGVVEAWADWQTVWASIDPLRGDEYFAAKQFNVELTHKITIRYRSGLTPTMRVLYGARVFSISAILNPDERNRELVLMCTEAQE